MKQICLQLHNNINNVQSSLWCDLSSFEQEFKMASATGNDIEYVGEWGGELREAGYYSNEHI